jgi:tRNA1(Val) A37 N6-methylase TrmN6
MSTSSNLEPLIETYSFEEKKNIAAKIKNIHYEMIDKEMDKLREIGSNAFTLSPRSRIGNNIVDYFTFVERLHTKGKYNVNFYEFLSNIDFFKQKKFIQNMFDYYYKVKNASGKKHEFIVCKEIYNISISAINIIRPLVYMEIYSKPLIKPKSILDFCAGWGGAAVAAAALNIDKYTGIDINFSLKQPYQNLIQFLEKKSHTKIDMRFEDALQVDYSLLDYDFVFTSPPYYFIQKYENNAIYKSKLEMNEKFYIPLFTNTFKYLKPNGFYAINVCNEVYINVLKPLLNDANEIFSYKKSKRQNNYEEKVYVWIKNI